MRHAADVRLKMQDPREQYPSVAIVLRCEQNLAGLFPLPAATNLDALLKRQTEAPAQRRRAPRKAR